MIEQLSLARAQAMSHERPTIPRHAIPQVPRRRSRLALRLRALLTRRPAIARSAACPYGRCA